MKCKKKKKPPNLRLANESTNIKLYKTSLGRSSVKPHKHPQNIYDRSAQIEHYIIKTTLKRFSKPIKKKQPITLIISIGIVFSVICLLVSQPSFNMTIERIQMQWWTPQNSITPQVVPPQITNQTSPVLPAATTPRTGIRTTHTQSRTPVQVTVQNVVQPIQTPINAPLQANKWERSQDTKIVSDAVNTTAVQLQPLDSAEK
jgi:hypothetical protein